MHRFVEYLAAWATAATALGTVLLAAATYGMARKTRQLAQSGQETAEAGRAELELLRDQVDAAKRQGEIAEAALTSSIQPLLVDVPRPTFREVEPGLNESLRARGMPERARDARKVDVSGVGWSVDEEGALLSVPVRNIGAGVARIRKAVVTIARDDALGAPRFCTTTVPPVVAPANLGTSDSRAPTR